MAWKQRFLHGCRASAGGGPAFLVWGGALLGLLVN